MANPIQAWIKALRLRTLPLALAVTGLGNLLVFRSGSFQWSVFFLSIVTTLLLQVLSNLANDYGDSIHGADSIERKGPQRAVQSGAITRHAMKIGMGVTAILSFVFGILLLWISFRYNLQALVPMLALGVAAIAAAYFYTNGAKPYGYQALGDISVFLFFGLVGVLGTSYLHLKQIDPYLILPAMTMGFWSTAVLNVNNMRDMHSDQLAGKLTVPLKLGLSGAKRYHILLVVVGFLTLGLYIFQSGKWALLAFLPGSLLIIKSLLGVLSTRDIPHLDAYLKPQALGTFLAVAGMWLATLYFG